MKTDPEQLHDDDWYVDKSFKQFSDALALCGTFGRYKKVDRLWNKAGYAYSRNDHRLYTLEDGTYVFVGGSCDHGNFYITTFFVKRYDENGNYFGGRFHLKYSIKDLEIITWDPVDPSESTSLTSTEPAESQKDSSPAVDPKNPLPLGNG